MSDWYYLANGQQQGPVPLDHLQHWLQAGQMPANTMVWTEGMANWQPANSVSELQPYTAAAPPPAPAGYAASPYAPGPGGVSDKSRVAYILLGLFLGGFGVHNFYAGYTGKGVAQLLLTVLGGWLVIPLIAVFVWVIVEICTVTEDAQGRPFT
jgi:TM2 domain-containing membrane protein YozV